MLSTFLIVIPVCFTCRVRGCLLVERHKLCVAGLPKCGTSTMIFLLRRMNGIHNWNSSDANQHNEKNELVWVHSDGNYTKYKQVMRDPSWVKIIITRDPAARFFSAYMDRVYRRHEVRPLHYHQKGIPNLQWVSSAPAMANWSTHSQILFSSRSFHSPESVGNRIN